MTSARVSPGPSAIHGTGLFARRTIRSGTHIGTYQGPMVKTDGTYVLWVQEGGRPVGRKGVNELRFLNHSDRPNAEFDGFELYALRTIRAGEEITINYHPDGADF